MGKGKKSATTVLAFSLVLTATYGLNLATAAGKPSPTATAKSSPAPSPNKPSQASPPQNSKSGGANPKQTTSPSTTQNGAPGNSGSNPKQNPNPTPGATTSTKSNASAKAEQARSITKAKSPDCTSTNSTRVSEPKNECSDFIVVFEPRVSRAASNKLVKDSGALVLRSFSNIFNGALVNGPLAKMQALAKNPNVLVVEDDLEVTTTAIQSPAPWGLDRLDQQPLPLNSTFDDANIQGANTISYVVDTGIDASNVDFEARVAAGFTAILDGRGSSDCNGHGSHVAGIIGGKTYGVAKQTKLVPVRVLDCAGSGSYSSVISGLDWIAANHRAGDAAVVNMSLGGPASSTLDGAVRNLISKGVSVVVAAGNSGADACNYSPARVLDAVTVGATTNADSRAGYSNFGTCLDIFAPGSAITSTWLGATGTNTINGTSMAAPHVAGVIARFIGQNPGLTPAQVANSVKTSSTKNVLSGIGTGSPNQLSYLLVLPDTTTVAPIDSSPTFKKSTPRGRNK
jgi:subtilisin family serine protease